MNQSSLFSFDDSTIWDSKIKLRLSIPEDQLNMLHTLQEWNKAQDNTIRIEKDSLIENSQTQKNSLLVPQNNENLRKQNIQLFEKHELQRKDILKTCKIYRTKFAKSISLLNINEVDWSESNSKTLLKRTSSLSNVYHLLNLSCIKYTKEPSSDNSSPEKHSSLHNSKKSSNFPAIDHKNKTSILEIKQNKDSFCRSEKTSEVMEVVPQLSVSTSTAMGKVVDNDTDIKTIEEKLSQHCNGSARNDQNVSSSEVLVKHDTSPISKVKRSAESHITISCENNSLDSCNIKETILVNTECNHLHQGKGECEVNKNAEVPCKRDFTNDTCSKENTCIHLNTQEANGSFVSTCGTNNLCSVEEKMSIDAFSVPVNNVVVSFQKINEIPKECEKYTAKQSCKESLQSNGKNINENCNKLNNKMDVSEEVNQKMLNGHSEKLDVPIAGKRKSDSKTRRSKKLKSEEKEEHMKVRSIKKVGEINYCAEDVKEILNIIKHFL